MMDDKMTTETDLMYQTMGISDAVLQFGKEIERKLKSRFDAIDQRADRSGRCA